MSDNKGYVGKISNSGSQKVEAPYSKSKKGNGTVKKGEDLRSKGGSSKD